VSREPQLLLEDILESGKLIQGYIAEQTWEGFSSNRQISDATVRRFEIIGEAVKGLPEEFKAKEPQVAWRAISGFRDVLAHAYFEIDASVV
jgi:uncharacterized protein with HEPN domain